MGASLAVPAILTILVSSVLITSSMTTADAAIFMKIEGITGDVTEVNHVGWIDVDSFQFGVGRAISSPVGGAERVVGATSVSDITITTAMSIASPAIFTEAVAGTTGKEVMIDFTKTAGGSSVVFAHYVLTSTLISQYSVSAVGDNAGVASESISLNFLKIEWTFTPINPDGTSGGDPVSASFDLSTGTV